MLNNVSFFKAMVVAGGNESLIDGSIILTLAPNKPCTVCPKRQLKDINIAIGSCIG
jgi:hypothetical protein